ncbi:hypothetical protein XA68_13700 [Ophiocordyceps unilateralis]|uniref:3-hydroxy-3-methylglutaryl coenzyme A reductase n=1 Tax=Ophiocordyceps unilateralis TaxID=268505 RepID=A0A2A9PB40_OPHUN|nr:hypothetical protein XA68_13700 [Ophiocordyceps unilateralis]
MDKNLASPSLRHSNSLSLKAPRLVQHLSHMAARLPVHALLLIILSTSLLQDSIFRGNARVVPSSLRQSLDHENHRHSTLVTMVFTDVLSSKAVLPCSVPAHDNISVALLDPNAAPLTACPPSQLRSYWRAPESRPAVQAMSQQVPGRRGQMTRWLVKAAQATDSPTSQHARADDLEGVSSAALPKKRVNGYKDSLWTNSILLFLILAVGFHGYLRQSAASVAHVPGLEDTISAHLLDERKQAASNTATDELALPQTAPVSAGRPENRSPVPSEPRSQEQLDELLTEKRACEMTDQELVSVVLRGKVPGHALEKTLNNDFERAIRIRRNVIPLTDQSTASTAETLDESKLPYDNYDWSRVSGACCENVVGYVPIPVGVAGPLLVDGKSYMVPMATTEGTLVASTSRGCKAINQAGGAVTVLTSDGMTRGPCISFETLARAGVAKKWVDSEAGQETIRTAFNSTSSFARLQSIKTAMAGTQLFIRFKAATGDAMGMNMISKGVEHALKVMRSKGFDDMVITSLSGNYCTDKKASALNWIEGRGKSIVAEAIIPAEVVRSVLKTDVESLVELNTSKNLIGSAMAGSVGGFNAHAANIVAAIFLATGQDPAQVVESANCITIMKNVRGSLQISVSMPSIEVGTLGGGTVLEPQGAMLDLLGVKGADVARPGENAGRLACIIGAAVLAGELSLCSALAAGHLVDAHMQHNRTLKSPSTRA